MRKTLGRGWVTVLAVVLAVAVAGAGSATAARMITGKQIKNGSITEKDLSKGVRAKLDRTGAPGPTGDAGAKGDRGAKGDPGQSALTLLTFADSAVSGGVTLGAADAVVTSTAAQLANANGAVGGPITLPAGPGKYAMTATVRIRTQGSGTYSCALQVSVNGGAFFEEDRASAESTAAVLRFSVPSGSFLNNSPVSLQYRVVCSGAATRTVTDTDMSIVGAAQAL